MQGGITAVRGWVAVLVGGAVLVGVALALDASDAAPVWLVAALQAVGGLAVIFGSCEAMILSVEGIAKRARMNRFVAGLMAGLASNIPELVMLGFVVAAEPRIGFIVVLLTLHVGAAVFGVYSGLLPRDAEGHARLPAPLVKLSTDLYACAGAAFVGLGAIMMLMNVFDAGDYRGEALGAADLYVLAGALLLVEVVSVVRLLARFSSDGEEASAAELTATDEPPRAEAGASDEPPSVGTIVFFGLLGVATSLLGGHAVGDFAEVLVDGLTEAGYSDMVGALILSVFASAGASVMIATAHLKGAHDIALANASGQINQVPFVVLPVVLILLAAFSQTGVIPTQPHGGVLAIDLETTMVVFLAFPSMLLLWKAVQDDGKVSWVETSTMVAIFSLTIYFLAVHG